MPTFLLLLTGFVSFLLIVIILLQRGRGGGLAGALGGMGGQSAFGTRAGDVFTRITVVLAIIWTVLAGLTGMAMQSDSGGLFPGGTEAATSMESTSPTGDAPLSQPAGSAPVISEPATSTPLVTPPASALEQPAAAPLTGESVPPMTETKPESVPSTPISTPAGSN
ncbi:preprotein translocase subunit SecG [Lacunimicrobium album]